MYAVMAPRSFVLSVLMTLVLGAWLPVHAGELGWQPQVGDVVFHTSRSAQSEAVQAATRSKWSHVGMVVQGEAGWQVVEAVQPVRVVGLADWLARGEGQRYEVFRLKDAEAVLAGDAPRELAKVARSFVGLDYDPWFGWGDERIYCSELVWKAYQRGLGIQLGVPHPVTDFDLEAPVVAEALRRRFPDGLPEGEVAISPQDLADSPALERVAGKR